jgi:ADP-heptose:LPS heptosyltransferase
VTTSRIAVVRALPGLGDLLCAVPGLAALRAAHPRARMTLVGLRSAGWFPDAFPTLVDDLLVVEGVPGLPEVTPDATLARRFFGAAAARRFDLAVQVHGSGVTTNVLTTMLGARSQVGAALPDAWRPPGTVVPYPADQHEIHRVLAVTTAAGAPPVGADVDLWVDRPHRDEAEGLLGGPALAGTPYACLHPGASRRDNRWSPDGFAAVGDRLAGTGRRVVLTGGQAERPVTAAVAAAMTAPVVDLSGLTTVCTLGAVFAGADVVVSNDTGAAHLAAAVRAASVVVFPSHGDPARWAPLDGARHRAVVPEPGAGPWPPLAAVLDAVAAQADVAGPASPPPRAPATAAPPPSTPAPPAPRTPTLRLLDPR